MQNPDFKELAGRIEGIGRAFYLLSAELHRQGAIDEQLLQAKMRRLARDLPPDLAVASTTLYEMADQVLRHYNLQRGGRSGQASDNSAADRT